MTQVDCRVLLHSVVPVPGFQGELESTSWFEYALEKLDYVTVHNKYYAIIKQYILIHLILSTIVLLIDVCCLGT